MEAEPSPDFMLGELRAPPCLHPEPPPVTPAQTAPRTPGCFRPSGRSFWAAHQDSVTALRLLGETAEGLAQPPTWDTQAPGPCWEPKALRTLGPLPLAKDAKNMLSHSPGSPEAPPASSAQPQRKPRKQSNPQRGAEKVDPLFEGVTLKFHIKPDCSLQIIPSYSPACSSRSQGPMTGPARGSEANPGGSEAPDSSRRSHGAPSTQAESAPPPASSSAEFCHLSPFLAFPLSQSWQHPGAGPEPGPRRCASCRTQRTPLWRDAEDGTPLCNACGIRYKKYGTRCSSCWLVPRKNVQPKRLCGRCGVSLGPHPVPAQEG